MVAVTTVVLAVPDTWQQLAPPASRYALAEHVVVDVSRVQALPEDTGEWIRVEIARLAGGRAISAFASQRIELGSGWPATLAEASFGDTRLALVLYELLELGAVATLTAPAALYATHRDAVLAVLGDARIAWDERPITIADLLDGAV